MTDNDTDMDYEGLAAEYALGTLDPREKRDAERLMSADASFRLLVRRWHNDLFPLLDRVQPVTPPPGAFEDIMRKIGERTPLDAEEISEVDSLGRSVRYWKRMAIAASLAVAMLSTVIVGRELTRPAPGTVAGGNFVAVLSGNDRNPAFVASVDIKKKVVHIVRLALPARVGKSYELWAVGGGRPAPESLGVVSDSQDILASNLGNLDDATLIKTTFAISLEQAGGSPTGQPTEVLFTGKLVPTRKKK